MKIRRLRDSITAITDSALRRISYTAGVTSMGKLVYDELRGILKAKMETILYKAVNSAEHKRKITVDEYVITSSISPKMWSIEPKAKSCGVRKSKQRSKRSKQRSKRSKQSKSRKKTSAIYKSLSNIRFYQKRYDCLNIPMASFARLSKEIGMDFKTDLRFTKKALIIFQYSIENYLLHILEKALLIATHSDRTRILPKDINLANR
jgi:histone H3/H4